MKTDSPTPLAPTPAAVTAAKGRLDAQRTRIAAAARAAGRDPGAIDLVAVGKNHPAASLLTLFLAGQRRFGENYAQELAAKAEALRDRPDLSFIFIGTIQSNKLKQILACAHEIATVTSLAQAEKIARIVREIGVPDPRIWLAVNAADEASKTGVPLREAGPLASAITRSFPELRLKGLLAIPPPLTAAELANAEPPALYLALARQAAAIGEGGLSLGMSDDLELAVKAGATSVRIGTALFGPRPPRPV